jgi:hypothetical protein
MIEVKCARCGVTATVDAHGAGYSFDMRQVAGFSLYDFCPEDKERKALGKPPTAVACQNLDRAIRRALAEV